MTLPRYNSDCKALTEASNHGKFWDEAQMQLLALRFAEGMPLRDICVEMGRQPQALLPKLVSMQALIRTATGNYRYDYHVNTHWFQTRNILCPYVIKPAKPADPSPATVTSTHKECIMSLITKIESKTFINDVEASTISDDDIFARIAKMEAQIDTWGKIKTKPKKLQARIDEMSKAIDDLVAYVDAR